jgi:hypothetical protein
VFLFVGDPIGKKYQQWRVMVPPPASLQAVGARSREKVWLGGDGTHSDTLWLYRMNPEASDAGQSSEMAVSPTSVESKDFASRAIFVKVQATQAPIKVS